MLPVICLMLYLLILPCTTTGYITVDSELLAILEQEDLRALALNEMIDLWMAFEQQGDTTAALAVKNTIQTQVGAEKMLPIINYLLEKYQDNQRLKQHLSYWQQDLTKGQQEQFRKTVRAFWQHYGLWLNLLPAGGLWYAVTTGFLNIWDF